MPPNTVEMVSERRMRTQFLFLTMNKLHPLTESLKSLTGSFTLSV